MNNSFSEKIKLLRHRMALNQFEFSKLIGIKQPTLSTYERGTSYPSMEILIAIADKCNVSLDWLCGVENHQCIYTGKDILNIILNIRKLPGFKYNIDVSMKNIDGNKTCYVTTLTFQSENAAQSSLPKNDIFDVNVFSEFMHEYYDMEKKLATIDDKDFAESYKNMWLEKELKKYSNYRVINQ